MIHISTDLALHVCKVTRLEHVRLPSELLRTIVSMRKRQRYINHTAHNVNCWDGYEPRVCGNQIHEAVITSDRAIEQGGFPGRLFGSKPAKLTERSSAVRFAQDLCESMCQGTA